MDDFSKQVRARLQLQAKLNEVKKPSKEYMGLSDKTVHSPGQTGCYCRDCLKVRKEEWRIGDINATVVGPRDQWIMYHWGCAERGALCSLSTEPVLQPQVAPPIRETIFVEDASRRRTKIEREAKFRAVASGKYHTLLLADSHQLFACGDNTYHALGTEPTPSAETEELVPLSVMHAFPPLGGSKIIAIAATEYASFALVDKPQEASIDVEAKEREAQEPAILRRKRPALVTVDATKDLNEHNRLYSWGRGERGVLGHGSTASEATPRVIAALASFRVTQIAAGRQHVLALTDHHGLFAFGDGRHGKLGTGTTEDHWEPVRLDAFDRFFVAAIGAGDEFSVALTAIPTPKNGAFVYTWGLGAHGQLGHRDNWNSKVPRAIDELKSEKITSVSAGARHSLAVTTDGDVWVWGHGLHGYQPDASMVHDIRAASLLYPRRVFLQGIHVIGAVAGRERTFVWGDRAGLNATERPPLDTSLLSGMKTTVSNRA
ncbi:hypothetical protein SPRG_06097 [Saprolegnia parasitica CBS 223.65]|uniref:Uncharacterized protein n=1 Tax=Saprolegnia parasitica (strain CBS 223.65) TaxID=695850 RepID=A0A067CQE2_SAPPC|nr:hypothetical protein SPRG_06097 [Saprolegnia parasitica CBS 223.65]KDO29042.1 hypothetical protein SPRG_06097 [Saprolegnia parasitica CBS 223.65]|eukprot:XP_012200212.1 hypothetical protein SPRG_06097 [Saprolegnia parasitica CBS 223.65]